LERKLEKSLKHWLVLPSDSDSEDEEQV